MKERPPSKHKSSNKRQFPENANFAKIDRDSTDSYKNGVLDTRCELCTRNKLLWNTYNKLPGNARNELAGVDTLEPTSATG